MQSVRRSILGLVVILAMAGAANGQQPSYLVLRPGGKVEKSCDTWNPGNMLVVSRTPYAYGYFGASASNKWYRSTNYNRSYTQWQRR
jgi:hypothetical protein